MVDAASAEDNDIQLSHKTKTVVTDDFVTLLFIMIFIYIVGFYTI